MTNRLRACLAALFLSLSFVTPALASPDDELNKTYNALMKVLAPADQAALKKAEKAWLAFRDAECAFRTDPYKDGSIYPSLVEACMTDLTNARTAQLIRQLNSQEGDTVGPLHVTSDENAAATGEKSCADEAGADKAKDYVDQCIMVSPATSPPCNVQNSCKQITDEITRGCALLKGGDRPDFCYDFD